MIRESGWAQGGIDVEGQLQEGLELSMRQRMLKDCKPKGTCRQVTHAGRLQQAASNSALHLPKERGVRALEKGGAGTARLGCCQEMGTDR